MSEASKKNVVLVIGATGETGQRVVKKLREKGIQVRLLYRSHRLDIKDVEEYYGDVRDIQGMTEAFKGVHTIISCLGNRKYFGSNGMHSVDVLGTKNIVELAKKNNIQHYILMSAFGIDRSSIFLSIFSRLLNNYFYHKKEVEKLVIQSGIPFTIVRPHELRNRFSKKLPLLNQQMILGLMMTVSRDTVAEVLASCVFENKVINTVFEVVEGATTNMASQFDLLYKDKQLHLKTAKTPIFPSFKI